ncbi:P-loop containing nucleoside triphosphate hydrolase [Arabidopsis thaliana x Arabidopsis arenosa]|uniref:P-loop containing nucleoside triphosphate hydrolase n=1 Tax=Arabidopsis thaliana x Arabidopsis arenosa TaxID=1240361 RepID=A0A8T2BP27_9BRAS|nr:P-loop containing nucleoside triphosphate hydrolase [Arabidopsis thaliana x Arabidopsis arenosa]
MAEGVVLFGVQKLWELLSRESERLRGVHEQVCELQRQLGRLQSLLNDADAKKHESKRVRKFLEDVKDIVYDAEDIIETFLLNEEREKEKGIKKSARRLACFLVDRRKFDSDIKRYLIVLDDVWKVEDWDRIKAVFPQNGEFRTEEELEAMGKKMVTYCGGLPLAVKVLGGLLATKHTIPGWKNVYDNIGSYIVGGSGGLDDNNLNSVYRLLCLSYEDLPMCLKHCFLSLANFPENYRINVETLFNYWAAEGIITSYYGRATIRDSAEGYLEELVRRNMVIAERNYATSRFDYCHMHNIMREVCLSKAEEENFLQIIKPPTSTSTFNAQPPNRSRRLAGT